MICFQGIEALEYYIDPTAEVPLDDPGKKSEEPTSGIGAAAPPVVPGQPPGQPVAPVTLDQPAVFCQKGSNLFKSYVHFIFSQENVTHMIQAK